MSRIGHSNAGEWGEEEFRVGAFGLVKGVLSMLDAVATISTDLS